MIHQCIFLLFFLGKTNVTVFIPEIMIVTTKTQNVYSVISENICNT